MLMLCWFYCIPFAKFLYFAIGPILLVFSFFMLRRGIYNARPGLRQTAFMLMFAVCIKIFISDIRLLKKEILCTLSPSITDNFCNGSGVMILETLGLVFILVSSLVLFHFYRTYAHVSKPSRVTPEEGGMRFWANLTMMSVLFMTVWQLAPWVGYLTVGGIPKIFDMVPWQALAIINLFILLKGFWTAEGCKWTTDVKTRSGRSISHNGMTWSPRDTMWMAVFIYLVTLGLSYVAHDVLAKGLQGG